jgi:two-component system OmpR family response regulator
MPEARLVVVEHDGWVLRLLQSGLRDHGFTVTTASSAREGYAKVCALEPDCVVCDTVLPDHDGYWLASRVRCEPSPVSITPLLLLSPEDDERARLRAFEAGADAFVTRPFRLDELVAQINALVVLARRMRDQRRNIGDSLAAGPPSSAEAASFEGELEHMSLPSLLAILEMERRTGLVSLRAGKRRATFDFVGGYIGEAALDREKAEPVAVLREALTWTKGRITFRAGLPAPARPSARPIRLLIAEAKEAEHKAPGPPPKKPAAPRTPALGDQPTRKVDVPRTVRPRGKDKSPPSSRRGR